MSQEMRDKMKKKLETAFNAQGTYGTDGKQTLSNIVLAYMEIEKFEAKEEERNKRNGNMSSRHIGIKGASNSNK